MSAPRVLSLFSGAGGLDYGLEAAGFETAVALEMDHDCCESLRASRPTWGIIERSIFDVPTDEILEVGGLKKGQVDLMVGDRPASRSARQATGLEGTRFGSKIRERTRSART